MCVAMSDCVYVCLRLSASVCVCQSVSQSVCPSVCLSASVYVGLYEHMCTHATYCWFWMYPWCALHVELAGAWLPGGAGHEDV